MVVRAIDQQAAAQRFLDEGRAAIDKIDAEDQAFAADFADEIKLRRQLFESPRANPRRARERWRADLRLPSR